MDLNNQDFIEIIKAFNSHGVKYMLVGGFAINYYGYNRTTADLDLWIAPRNDNKTRVVNSLLSLGYSLDELNEFVEQDFSLPFSFQIGAGDFYIDVMTAISGVDFEEAYKGAISEVVNQEHTLKIIHRNHLIINKTLSGRTKDKADVEALQKIAQNNPPKL